MKKERTQDLNDKGVSDGKHELDEHIANQQKIVDDIQGSYADEN